jgi:hypothetical protein
LPKVAYHGVAYFIFLKSMDSVKDFRRCRRRHLTPDCRSNATPDRHPIHPLSSPKRTPPLPLPPPPPHHHPSFKAKMAGVMAPLGHHHHRTVRSPPSPSAPIKGTSAMPHHTPHRPPFHLSRTGDHHHHALSSSPFCRRRPVASPPLRLL